LDQDGLKTALIVTPVVALMTWAGVYLWRDYQISPENQISKGQLEVIGQVSFTNKNVKRKTADSLYWNPLNKDDQLYMQDTIRTGPDSYAVLKLKDASVLEVNENSLIVLEKDAQKLSVDFKTGDISTKGASKNLAIKVKDSIIDASTAELKLKTDSQQKTQILVTKGKATLTDAKKVKMDLDVARAAEIAQAGQAQALAASVILQTPKDQAIILSPVGVANHPFTWTVLNPDLKEETFELSKNSKFLKPETFAKVAHQSIQAPLEKGRSFWRVGWKNKEGKINYSEIRSLTVTQDQRITLTHPPDDASLEINPTDAEIQFSWVAEGEPKSFLFEMADSPTFQRTLQSRTTAASPIKVTDLKTGVYYWRVSAFGDNNEEMGRSPIYKLTTRKILPEGPRLIAPEHNLEWTLKDSLRFEWENNPTASSYRVSISRDSERRQLIKSEVVHDNFYVWRWKEGGTFYWSVEALNNKGETISRSRTNRFVITSDDMGSAITLIFPKNQGLVKRESKEPIDPIAFEWKSELPPNFTLIASKTPDFKEVFKQEKLTKLKTLVRLKQTSNYYWKVLWIDPKDPKHTETSPTWVFKLEFGSTLPGPILIEPLKDTKITVPENPAVEFTWKPVPLAKKYHLIVEKITDREDSSERVKTSAVDMIVTETKATSAPLEGGTYKWRVHAVDEKDSDGLPSDVRPLIIDIQEALSAPKLKAPVVK